MLFLSKLMDSSSGAAHQSNSLATGQHDFLNESDWMAISQGYDDEDHKRERWCDQTAAGLTDNTSRNVSAENSRAPN